MPIKLPGASIVGVGIDDAGVISLTSSTGEVFPGGTAPGYTVAWLDDSGRINLENPAGERQQICNLSSIVGGAVLTGTGPNTAQEIPAGSTPTAVSLGDVVASDGMWVSTKPATMVAPITGPYLVAASLRWQSTLGGTRRLLAIRNGVNVIGQTSTACALDLSDPSMNVMALTQLHAGDQIQIVASHTSPAALKVTQVVIGMARQ